MFLLFSEFLEWKNNLEVNLMVSFTEHNSARLSKDGFQSSRAFYCSRSFTSKSARKSNGAERNGVKKRKNRQSGKMETVCTAKIKIVQELPSDEILAEICLNHYGHALDEKHLQSLRIPALEREKLAGKITSGVPLKRVFDDAKLTCDDLSDDALSDRDESEDFGDLNPDKASFTSKLTALHMLTRKDIRNIASLAKRNKKSSDAISVE